MAGCRGSESKEVIARFKRAPKNATSLLRAILSEWLVGRIPIHAQIERDNGRVRWVQEMQREETRWRVLWT